MKYRALQWLVPLVWLLSWFYLGGLLFVLAFFLFIESVPYISLIVLPIPLLAPAYLMDRLYAWRWSARVYVLLAFLGTAALLGGRVWLDLWYPMDI